MSVTIAHEAVKQMQQKLESHGMRVIRVYVDPATFPSWRQANELRPDAPARSRYGSEKAAEVLDQEQAQKS